MHAELKRQKKVLENLFRNMTLKKLILPLYYYQILAAGRLRSIDSNKI